MFSGIFNRFSFILIGLLSVFWFAIRVIPKPSRAAYPCQKAAAPVASGFLVWLSGMLASHFLLQKFKKAFRSSGSVIAAAGFICMLGVFMIMVLSHPAPRVSAGIQTPFVPADPPNTPVGIPRGIFPGRVVWVHDPAATSWDGQNGFWWEEAHTDIHVVDAMLSRTVRGLAGKSNLSEAWDALFRYFNQEKHQTDAGYRTGEKIAVKLNLAQNVDHGYGFNKCYTAPQLVYNLLKQLVQSAGVPADCITFYDATSYIPKPVFDICKADFPDVHFVDWEGGDGREKYVRDTSSLLHWAKPLTEELKGGNPGYLVQCLTRADYVINLGHLKGHALTAVTFCAKNHFGSLSADYQGSPHESAPQAIGVHPYIAANDVDLGGPNWVFSGRAMNTYNPIVELMGHKDVGEKTVLFLVDGLYGVQSTLSEVDTDMKWQSPPFNGDWTSSLIASQDGVAIESVCLDLVRNEPTMTEVRGTVDNYLHEAARADDPPSGTFYDPEGDGSRLVSLGVHEHWNNATDRQYSVNLGTGPGIELIENPEIFTETFEVELESPYAAVSGSGVYDEGTEVEISISPGTVQTADGIRQVFNGWVGEGEGAYTGPDSIFTITLNHDILETAVWETQVALSVQSEPAKGGTVHFGDDAWVRAGRSVELSAVPNTAEGYVFKAWTGDVTGTDNPLTVMMDSPKSIRAVFEIPTAVIQIVTTPCSAGLTVDGEVFSGSASLTWNAGSSHNVKADDICIVDETRRYVFDAWSDGGARAHQVTASTAGSGVLSAAYQLQYLLQTAVQNKIGGTVSPASSQWHDDGETVIVTATPDEGSGYVFREWWGMSETDNPFTVVMDAPKVLIAVFERASAVQSLEIPETYDMKQNSPNPFNPETRIDYQLPKAGEVTIEIFDLTGRKVQTLVHESKQPGSYQTVWDGRNDAGRTVSSGTYLCIMRCGSFQKRMKAIFLK